MWWHMLVTMTSPKGSASISAPQWASSKYPWRLVDHLVVDVHVVVGEARVELEDLEDGRHAVALDVHDLAQAVAVEGARPRPLLHRQLLHDVAPEAHGDGGAHGTVEKVHDEGELPDQPDEGLLGEVLVAEVGVEGPRIVFAVGHGHRLRSRHLSGKTGKGTVMELGDAALPRSGSSASATSAAAWPPGLLRAGDRPGRLRRAARGDGPLRRPARVAADPAELGRSADVVVVAVVTDEQVLAVLDGAGGALGRRPAGDRPS